MNTQKAAKKAPTKTPKEKKEEKREKKKEELAQTQEIKDQKKPNSTFQIIKETLTNKERFNEFITFVKHGFKQK